MNSTNEVAIVGVGLTKFSRFSGRSILSLACEAVMKAVLDAGLDFKDIDGIATYELQDSVDPLLVARALGLPPISYHLNYRGGANSVIEVVGSGAAAIATGLAHNVVILRASNFRSGRRLGGTGMRSFIAAQGDGQFTVPYGWMTWTQHLALWCRRHMIKYGTTSEHLGAVAVTQRQHAMLNERAMMRTPLTLEEYLHSRIIADPFRILDCCLETDAGGAIVLTSLERARNLRQKPVIIRAVGSVAAGAGLCVDYAGFVERMERSFGEYLSPSLYAQAGVNPADIDFAELYDCFTWCVIDELEAFGFCKRGEGGEFVKEGKTRLGGKIPVNTHGGLLCEGYLHTMNHIVEAVEQLRGQSGVRQVANARLGLVTSGAGSCGGAMILSAEEAS